MPRVSVRDARGRQPLPHRVAAVCDACLDCAVVLLATWTVVYHLSLLLGVGADAALAVEAVVLVAAAALWISLSRRRSPTRADAVTELETEAGVAPRSPRLTAVTLASAGVAGISMATSGPWLLVWVSWLVAGVTGAVVASRMIGRWEASPCGLALVPISVGESAVALSSATLFAAFSLVALRPNPDDLFYVNLSQWVAEHGTFPVRDTLYGDLRYPMANWPPLASYDVLTGSLAHLLGTAAGTVVYLVVPPVATFLAVLALWRLLRAWRTPRVTVALVAALLFLLWDGTSSYGTPGNLFVTRLWQGKVILLCVLVPVLFVHLLRYVERPSGRLAAWLFVCGTATVALSTTAVFLVPVIAVAGVAPLLRRAPRAALAGFAALSAYPLGAGAVTLALGGRSADDFGGRRQFRFDPVWFGHEVFLSGLLALVAVVAVLVGALVVAHPVARLTCALVVVSVGVTFVPGLTRLAYDVVGLGPTLWRITWAATVAALVGVLASWVAARLRTRWLAGAAGLGAVVVLAATGAPIWAADTSTTLDRPLHWQRGADASMVTDWLLANTSRGDVVLAPDGLSITVAVTTTDIKVVAPRDYYLDYLRDHPTFHYDERLTLDRLVNEDDGWAAAAVPAALRDLDVRSACIYRNDPVAAWLLRDAGYRPALVSPTYRCFLAQPSGG